MVLRHPIRRSILVAALVHTSLRKKNATNVSPCVLEPSRARALPHPPFADAKHQLWGTYVDAHRDLTRATRATRTHPCARAHFSASQRSSRRQDRARRAREGCGSGSRRAVMVGRRGPFTTTGAREDALERRCMRGEGGFVRTRAREG